LGTSSEKGYRRKSTENRVTSWTKLFWGNLGEFTLIYEEISFWGNLELGFFGFMGGDPRRVTEEGGPLVFPFVLLWEFWGIILMLITCIG
jgi:hypothetical protein